MKATKRILTVNIKRMIDDSPDTSWLGKYSNKAETEYAIDRAHSLECIENDVPQQDKLKRIANSIENDRPICEEHLHAFEDSCEVCEEEKAYTHAMEQVQELAECDCGEHGDMERGQFRYFNACVENYKGETSEDTRKYIRQDYERMESLNAGHWCFIGIQAEAQITVDGRTQSPKKVGDYTISEYSTIQRITSGGLWGIESDSDKSHLESVEKEELSDLREQLKALGFSSRAISSAFKNVERKEE